MYLTYTSPRPTAPVGLHQPWQDEEEEEEVQELGHCLPAEHQGLTSVQAIYYIALTQGD